MKKHVPRKKSHLFPELSFVWLFEIIFLWRQEASSQSNSSISSNQPGSLSSSDMVFSKSWPTLRRCWLSGSRCVERIRFTTPRPWRWESPSKRVSSSTFGSPNWTFLIQILPVEKNEKHKSWRKHDLVRSSFFLSSITLLPLFAPRFFLTSDLVGTGWYKL